ncbi:hypothetical protein KAI87_09975, partial [Myxococcota bacterium]|nr:hypothetical protein [Myxococcota bacterium]
FRLDDNGLPVQDPMHDEYMDDDKLRMTGVQGAIRLRKNKQATMINVKPGGGREDPATGIRQRVEVGLELTADSTVEDATKMLGKLAGDSRWNNTVFNHADRQVRQLDSELKLANALKPWLNVVQDRHKFTVKNEKTGVEIELSLDKVLASTIRPEHAMPDGSPRSTEFFILEAELDHLQLASNNQSSYAAGGASSGVFKSNDSQDTWLKNTGTDVTMDIEPRLHELDDLNNAAFRSTDSYKSFEGVNELIKKALFPAGFQPAIQKAAQAGQLLGLSPVTREAVMIMAQRLVAANGLQWSDKLEAAIGKIADMDGRLDRMAEALTTAKSGQPMKTLESIAGMALPPVKYDPDAVVQMAREALDPLGLQVTPELERFLRKLDTAKVQPSVLADALRNASRKEDKEIFTSVAQKMGLGAPPAPVINMVSIKADFDNRVREHNFSA